MKKAFDLKDRFYELMHKISYKEARDVIDSFIDDLYKSKLPEFKTVTRTCNNWKDEIVNSYITMIKNN